MRSRPHSRVLPTLRSLRTLRHLPRLGSHGDLRRMGRRGLNDLARPGGPSSSYNPTSFSKNFGQDSPPVASIDTSRFPGGVMPQNSPYTAMPPPFKVLDSHDCGGHFWGNFGGPGFLGQVRGTYESGVCIVTDNDVSADVYEFWSHLGADVSAYEIPILGRPDVTGIRSDLTAGGMPRAPVDRERLYNLHRAFFSRRRSIGAARRDAFRRRERARRDPALRRRSGRPRKNTGRAA
jgi:hypothetical protein